jgi:hypothetical protein
MQPRKIAYHNSHASTLHDSAEHEHADSDLPSSSPTLYATGDDDDEGDQCAELDDDAEGDEEANGSPHVTEGRVLGAVGASREGNAGTRDG